ncbi:DUF3011 domain-containing protein [Lysobacter fragariae]
MKILLKPLLVAFCLLALPMAMPAAAQRVTAKAYAPENLRQLAYNDQVRVIGQEFLEQSGGRRIPDDQLRFYLDQVNRSDWNFSRIKQDIAQSLADNSGGGYNPGNGGYYPGNGSSIRCESTDNRTRNCRTPWQGRSRIVRRLSDSRCDEGRNWSSNYGEVTVWAGCRAEFAEDNQDGPIAGGQIRCESTDNRQRSCRTPWEGRSRVARQLSDTRCVEGRNWTSQYNEVSVWGGCRADFAADYNADPGYGQGGSIRCESTRSSPRTCNTPWSGGTRLVRQLSESRCVEGQTWSARPGTVHVSRGCRGEFAPDGYNNGGGWGTGNRTVSCSSVNGRSNTCQWPPGQGRPRLQRQLSNEPCVSGRTWGMVDNNTIWVSHGCRAIFGN